MSTELTGWPEPDGDLARALADVGREPDADVRPALGEAMAGTVAQADPMWESAYMDVQRVLDEALGTEEEDGAGSGIAGDVWLLAKQRDDARAEVTRLRTELKHVKAAVAGQLPLPLTEVPLLGQRVRVKLDGHVVQEGRLLSFGDDDEGPF